MEPFEFQRGKEKARRVRAVSQYSIRESIQQLMYAAASRAANKGHQLAVCVKEKLGLCTE